MRLILTHENADFDAIASQMAAHKLYPDAVPLLPRRINRNVEQFLTLYWDAFSFTRPADWKRQRVESVVLVDTQTFNNVRGMVRQPRVCVFDHHAPR
ncbi:MAG TPA: DHH family phosphoesterase, partial [Anaerolineae bacterium]